MKRAAWQRQRLLNRLHTVLLVAAMALLLGTIGALVGGLPMALGAVAGVLLLYLFNPAISPRLVMALYRARAIHPDESPQLYRIHRQLCERAGLAQMPLLHYVPSDVLNAFSVGAGEDASIALSDGLLRRLELPELAAVLAHEIAHIVHDDVRIMGLADLVARATWLLSLFGQLLLLINLPLFLFAEEFTIDWWVIALLILAPTLSALLQLALSRKREYHADVTATALLGDPLPLAAALARMEYWQGHYFEQILRPGHRLPEPSLLRTHPPTEERIRRLLALRDHNEPLPWRPLPLDGGGHHGLGHRVAGERLRPRRRYHGLWY